MPRPKNKVDLITLSQANFERLNDLIDQLPPAQQKKNFPDGTMNRNIRDVLAHLYHWHLLFLGWYKIGMSGKKPDIPAKGYNWKETPALNRMILEKYQVMSLGTIRKKFAKSHDEVQQVIKAHANEELWVKGVYPWTGGTCLGAYLVSATSSHYDWAFKLIRKALK